MQATGKKPLELLLAVMLGILLCAPAQARGASPAPGDLVVSRLSGGGALLEWYDTDG